MNEANIRELDSKVAMEAYLREKKEAILKDRKDQEQPVVDEDQKSCLQQVQEKYSEFKEDRIEALSRKSQISRKDASVVAKSGVAQSLVGSAALLRQRLWNDFGIVEVDPNEDQRSYVSGFDDEIDEWAALNKYALYNEYKEA